MAWVFRALGFGPKERRGPVYKIKQTIGHISALARNGNIRYEEYDSYVRDLVGCTYHVEALRLTPYEAFELQHWISAVTGQLLDQKAKMAANMKATRRSLRTARPRQEAQIQRRQSLTQKTEGEATNLHKTRKNPNDVSKGQKLSEAEDTLEPNVRKKTRDTLDGPRKISTPQGQGLPHQQGSKKISSCAKAPNQRCEEQYWPEFEPPPTPDQMKGEKLADKTFRHGNCSQMELNPRRNHQEHTLVDLSYTTETRQVKTTCQKQIEVQRAQNSRKYLQGYEVSPDPVYSRPKNPGPAGAENNTRKIYHAKVVVLSPKEEPMLVDLSSTCTKSTPDHKRFQQEVNNRQYQQGVDVPPVPTPSRNTNETYRLIKDEENVRKFVETDKTVQQLKKELGEKNDAKRKQQEIMSTGVNNSSDGRHNPVHETNQNQRTLQQELTSSKHLQGVDVPPEPPQKTNNTYARAQEIIRKKIHVDTRRENSRRNQEEQTIMVVSNQRTHENQKEQQAKLETRNILTSADVKLVVFPSRELCTTYDSYSSHNYLKNEENIEMTKKKGTYQKVETCTNTQKYDEQNAAKKDVSMEIDPEPEFEEMEISENSSTKEMSGFQSLGTFAQTSVTNQEEEMEVDFAKTQKEDISPEIFSSEQDATKCLQIDATDFGKEIDTSYYNISRCQTEPNRETKGPNFKPKDQTKSLQMGHEKSSQNRTSSRKTIDTIKPSLGAEIQNVESKNQTKSFQKGSEKSSQKATSSGKTVDKFEDNMSRRQIELNLGTEIQNVEPKIQTKSFQKGSEKSSQKATSSGKTVDKFEDNMSRGQIEPNPGTEIQNVEPKNQTKSFQKGSEESSQNATSSGKIVDTFEDNMSRRQIELNLGTEIENVEPKNQTKSLQMGHEKSNQNTNNFGNKNETAEDISYCQVEPISRTEEPEAQNLEFIDDKVDSKDESGSSVKILPKQPSSVVENTEESEDEELEILDIHQYFTDDLDLSDFHPQDFIGRIEAIHNHAQTFENQVNFFEGEKHSLDFFVLDEKLMRLIENLDRIRCHEDSEATWKKVEAIEYIKNLQAALESCATEQ